ncbi:MAG: patatin family protein [Clostridia bacterium]|nr:patatin family protein [Clostridia bacterium]
MSVGLVLEGGGMRGAYTAGVLAALHSEGIAIDYIAGVSAGALTAMNYISGQPRRGYDVFVSYAEDERYMGLSHLREKGMVFNFDFVLGTLAHELLPFDFDAFFKSPCRLKIGTTELNSGGALFFDKSDLLGDDRLTALRASASLPLVSQTVRFRGFELLDGGLASPIPIEQSIADGNDRHIVVMTRPRDYVKKKSHNLALIRRRYARYPMFLELMARRHEIYSAQREKIFRLEREGKAVVLCPQAPLTVGRYERRREKLASLYDSAVIETCGRIEDIRRIVRGQ